MIHSIDSRTLGSFKRLEFHQGLNLLVAQKSSAAGDDQSRNKSGKSSLILLIHFLLGARVDSSSIFACAELADHEFSMDFDVGAHRVTVWRKGSDAKWVHVIGPPAVFEPMDRQDQQGHFPSAEARRRISNEQWKGLLAHHLFEFPYDENDDSALSVRGLLPYFARIVSNGIGAQPHKHSSYQTDGEAQVATAWLLGLDSATLRQWQEWRQRNQVLKELKRAGSLKILENVLGGDRRTLLKEQDAARKRIEVTRRAIEDYRLEESYEGMNAELTQLTAEINDLLIQIGEDDQYLGAIRASLRAETPPGVGELEAMYQEASFVVPASVVRRFEEVAQFHESLLKNRRQNLATERVVVEGRLARRKMDLTAAEKQRSALMKTMEKAGTLVGFAKLQTRLAVDEQRVEAIQNKLDVDEAIRQQQQALEKDREELEIQLQAEIEEQRALVEAASNSISTRMTQLYREQAKLSIEATKGGLKPKIKVHGQRATSVKGLLTVCWDLYVMEALARRLTGPGFLVHDSQLFDSADKDQRAMALHLGAEAAEKAGFQYIVTMNSDQIEGTTFIADEARARYWLPVMLTGSEGGGGLFGILFD